MIYSLIPVDNDNLTLIEEISEYSFKNRPDFKLHDKYDSIKRKESDLYLFLEDGEVFGSALITPYGKDRRVSISYTLKDASLSKELIKTLLVDLPLRYCLNKAEITMLSEEEIMNEVLKDTFILDATLRQAIYYNGEFKDLNYYSYLF